MTKFYIEYNPYLEKCIFKMNGKDLCGKKSNSKFKAKVDTRLQILLGESINWKGLFEEIAIACDDDEIGLLFRGRRIDYEDLSYALNLYKGEAIFDLSFEDLIILFKKLKRKIFLNLIKKMKMEKIFLQHMKK